MCIQLRKINIDIEHPLELQVFIITGKLNVVVFNRQMNKRINIKNATVIVNEDKYRHI